MICKKCGRNDLGPDDFHKDSRAKTGLRSECKDCRNQKGYDKKRYVRKREELLEKSRRYYYENREARIAYQLRRHRKKKEDEAKKNIE
jgi:hypothetical protein